jgi:hypothetical protein
LVGDAVGIIRGALPVPHNFCVAMAFGHKFEFLDKFFFERNLRKDEAIMKRIKNG